MSRGQRWLQWAGNQRTECAKLSGDGKLKCNSGSSGSEALQGQKVQQKLHRSPSSTDHHYDKACEDPQYSKRTLLPLLVVRLLKKWPPRNWSCPRSPMQRGGKGAWCQQEGVLISREEMSISADSKSGHFAGDTGTLTMMDQT